jgi:DNA polymerase-3 subunit epsilon
MLEDFFNADQPLYTTVFCVFDVETTGLTAAFGHRICEIACLRSSLEEEVGRFESLVDPGRSVSAGAYSVNRISAEMLDGAPTFEQVAPSVLALMEGAVLVAHNAPFDLSFLAIELDIADLPPPEGPVVDTLALVRRVYRFASNSLRAVASNMEVEVTPIHRAMSDVRTTWLVLERILLDLKHRWGVETVGQLLDFQGGSVPYPHPRTLPLPPAIAEALEAGKRVWMTYVNAGGQESHRMIRPLRVNEYRGNLYLSAHCYQAGELRTFRLDRVIELTLED